MASSARWLKMPHKTHGNTLMIHVEEWRTPLAAGSTTGTPLNEAIYATNWLGHSEFLQYNKDAMGIVRFRGSIARGTPSGAAVSQQLFTMPVGYRPGQTQTVGYIVPAAVNTTVKILMDTVIGGANTGIFRIGAINAANGVLATDAATDAGTRIYFDGISYRAEDV